MKHRLGPGGESSHRGQSHGDDAEVHVIAGRERLKVNAARRFLPTYTYTAAQTHTEDPSGD